MQSYFNFFSYWTKAGPALLCLFHVAYISWVGLGLGVRSEGKNIRLSQSAAE